VSDASGIAPSCAGCRHFSDDPHEIEREVAGLTVFGSGHASVVGDDGLCRRHGRILGRRGYCDGYVARDPAR